MKAFQDLGVRAQTAKEQQEKRFETDIQVSLNEFLFSLVAACRLENSTA